MTDYAEEQANEIEALESIYPDEFEELNKSPWVFQITIQPEAGSSSEEEDQLSVCLKFKFGASYPDEVPIFSIESSENLTDEDCSEILRLLQEESEANIGMVMTFTLVSATQEFLTKQVDAAKQRRLDEEKAREEAERKKAEQPVFFGTPVTVESFAEWKRNFQAEMASGKSTKQDASKKRLSGKELFERDASLTNSDMQLLELDDDDLVEGVATSDAASASAEDADVDVDESLFEDIDGLDLDADIDIT